MFVYCLFSWLCSALCKQICVSSSCLSSELFFFYHLQNSLYPVSVSAWPPHRSSLPLCKKKSWLDSQVCAWQKWPTYVIHSMFCLFISLTDRFFCLLMLCWQGNYSEMGREAKEAEFTSLLLRDSVLEFNREFTTGQNLGSENFTSWSGGVVTAVWLNGENIFVCFLKISTWEQWYRCAILGIDILSLTPLF